jgi:hypothetical protein
LRAPGLLALLVAAALLAACGGGEEGSTQAGGGSQGAEEQAAPSSRAGESAEPAPGGEASIEGFGSEAEGAEREAILSVFSGYLDALAEKDYRVACEHLSAVVRESLAQLAGGDSTTKCPSTLPALLAPTAAQIAQEQAKGEVTKVRVEGERGFVVFKAPGAELYQLTMLAEGGEWKAASVAAAVLVPEL